MDSNSLALALLALADEKAREALLNQHQAARASELMAALEARANEWRLSEPTRALVAVEIILQIATRLGDQREQANGLRLKGNLLIHLGRYEESIACYAQAKAIRLRDEDELEMARLQVGWTAALKNLARYNEALSLALATQELLLKYEKWSWLASLEMNLGTIYWLIDRFDEALTVYTQSQQHFEQVGNAIGAAQVRLNMARILGNRDRFREALEHLHSVRAILEAQKQWLPLARADLNIAILSSRQGHYQKAWECFTQSKDMFKQLGSETEMAVVDLYHARLYLSLNLFPEALALAQQVRTVFAPLDMARHVALADFIQATAYQGLDEEENALHLFSEARPFFITHEGNTWATLIDLERAVLLRKMERFADALSLLKQVEAIFTLHGLSIRVAQTRLLQAECFSDLGRVEQAEPLYQSIVDMPPSERLPTLAYRAFYGLGQLAEKEQDTTAAHQHYQAAIKEIESIRQQLRVDEFKASFLDDKLGLYQAAVRVSLEMEQLEEAFDYVERAKSSALLDLLARNLELRAQGGADVPAGHDINQAIWERLGRLKEKWNWHINALEQPPVEEPNQTRRAEAIAAEPWSELQQIEGEISHLLRQLQGDRLQTLLQEGRPSWQEITAHLDKETLLIEYFSIDDEIVAFLLTTDGLTVCQAFPYSLREIERSLQALDLSLKGLSGLDPAYIKQVLTPLALRHLKWLYNALIAPLASAMATARKLIIVPDNLLYYLPFHAFHDGQHYLSERFELHYAPSTSVLILCHQTRSTTSSPSDKALIIGYAEGADLPHINTEVETIAAVLSNPLLFQAEEATRSQLHQQASHCRLIHIACHATFRDDNPLFSYLELADGPLNVIDLYHLKLNASLVTLSACETGISQLKGGDLFGLVRGCLYAGSPSLVASLWQVDDRSTAILMAEFYRRLEAGEAMASALRAAQLGLREFERVEEGQTTRPYDHPHYWAPFFLMGADGTL